MEIKRKNFQGVLNILSFNRHFYILGLGVLTVLIISYATTGFSDRVFWIIMVAFLYGLLMPLIVSAYVYDFSGYYNFHWLQNSGLANSGKIVNVNAGFDETSFIIRRNFPQSDLKVFDFYDPKRHTEPAIIRARKVSLIYPDTVEIKSNFIPVEDKSVDIIFLLSAAHEIRNAQERIVFLAECYRICKPNGKVVMVEHLRDFPNFLAFTIGFTHFFARSTWKSAFTHAGFNTFNETKFTPFMSIFHIEP